MTDRPEARIPCPQCGGAIHPVAGKCKHCKTDLAALRVGKPQAAIALPQLAATAAPPPAPAAGDDVWARPGARSAVPVPPAALESPYSGGLAMREIDTASAQFSPMDRDSEPVQILPPRPTGRMFAVAPVERWPLAVIAISVLAILLSIGALAR